MVHGTSPITDPSVVICADTPGYETAVLADLDKHYELHPVILVVGSESRGHFLKHIQASKFKYAEGGHQHVLAEIRSWEYEYSYLRGKRAEEWTPGSEKTL